MKTIHHSTPRTALVAVVAIVLASTSPFDAKGKKPVKPPPDPDPPAAGHRYSVTVNESVVFWGDDPLITGRIEDEQGETLLINRGMVGGINPYANLNELVAEQDCPNPGEWSTCFLDPIDGTVQIPSRTAPHFQLGFAALNRSGKKLYYIFEAEASSEGTWDLYDLLVGASASMTLHTWRVEAGTGPVTKGCIGCGDLAGSITVTITREEDTFMPEMPSE